MFALTDSSNTGSSEEGGMKAWLKGKVNLKKGN
jgi:hypothetical protein